MLAWIIDRQITAFEQAYDYDMDYARAMLRAGTAPVLRYLRAIRIGAWRQGVPAGPWHAAKLVAIVAEDCGPCTQLAVRLATDDGVPPDVLYAVLRRDLDAVPDDVALGVRFADAMLARDLALDDLREDVLARWGWPGLVSLALGTLSSRLYPDLKFALGYGKACTRVELGDGVVWTPGETLGEAG